MSKISLWPKLTTAVIAAVLLISDQTRRVSARHNSGQDVETQAVAGTLDPTFGNGGKVVTDFFGDDDAASCMAIQQDGKIVAGGFGTTSGANPHPEFALARYNTDGSLDQSFGSNGKVNTDFFSVYNNLNGIVIQPDGKIIAVGNARHAGAGQFDFALARYNPDGSLDKSFGTSGLATTSFLGHDSANAVALTPGGKIVVAGSAVNQGGNPIVALVRYNSDGSPDASFGTGGKVTTSIGFIDQAFAVAVEPDSAIVVAGTDLKQGGNYEFAVLRYTSDGRLDPTFGAGGVVTTAFSDGLSTAYALALQRDGKIIAAGIAQGSGGQDSADFALARYNADGSLDSSFNGGGLLTTRRSSSVSAQAPPAGAITTDFSGHFDSAYAVVVQDDGKILAAGASLSRPQDFDSQDVAIARYKPDGELDASFGENGKTVTDFFGHLAYADAIALQSDGRIVVAGASRSTSDHKSDDFALARYTIQSDFGIAFDQPNLNSMAGTRASVEALVNRTGGFSGNVTITAPDASAIKVKIKPPDPVTTAGTSVKYSLKIKAAAPAGPHQLAFTASDDAGRTRNATLTLNIE
jgi:uncharacterized delta-60 repeat protein